MADTENFIETNGDAAIHDARDAIGKAARQVKKINANLMDGAKERTDKVATLLEKQGRVAFSNLQHIVSERPAASVGVAVGTGLILGLLLSARRS